MPAFPVACPTSTSSLAGLLTCCSKLWQLLGTRWGRIRRVGSYPAFNRDANLQRNKKKLPTSGGPGRRVQQRREEVQSCRERLSELERPTDILAGRGRRRRRSSNTQVGGSLLSLEVEALIEIGVKVRCTGHAEGRNSSLVPRDHGACARDLGLGYSVMLMPWLKSRFNESPAKTRGRKYCLAYRRFRARLTGQPER